MAAGNDSTADNLIANYVNNAYFASTLVNTAGQYVWDRNYDGAEKLYRAVIEIHPNNPYTTKARVGLARLDVLNLIEEKKWSLARQQIESMAADFNNEPDLAVSLIHIGKEFTWQHRYSEAKETFGLLLKQPVNNSFLQEAKLWLARAQVCLLIGRAKDEEIVASTDKLISDFETDAGLPEAIYWISKEYEWKKSTGEDRAGWYDAPNSVFQRLIQKFGYTSFGIDAEWDQKRLKYRMNIFKLMKEADQNAVDAEIEKMVADLSGRPDAASELYWIAFGYEEADNHEKAKSTYNRIIMNYPQTAEADSAALDVRRLDIWKSFNDGDINKASIQIDKFVDDFKNNPNINTCLGSMAAKCCLAAVYHDKNKATIYLHRGKIIWEKLMDKAPSPEIAFYIGNAYKQMGDCNDAIPYLKRTIKEWPDYKLAWKADSLLADCLEK